MLSEEYRQQNIERVLDEALKLCEEIGLAALNKTNLAKRAHLSTKSIQRYFRNKTDLIYQVSKKLTSRNAEEINEAIMEAKSEGQTGLERIESFLKIHNEYVIRRYKDTIFVQNADIFCRYSGEVPDKYWQTFRSSDRIEKGFMKLAAIGIADGSVSEQAATEEYLRVKAITCAGLLDRLATDIDCRVMTVEEAIGYSNSWIEHMIRYIKA